MTITTNRRRGFTLIELLVVIAIIVVLFGIAVLVAPVLQSEKSTQGAQQLEGWLEIAKNRSVRDGAARGLRLIPDQANPNFVRQFQYVGNVEPFTGGQIIVTEPQFQIAGIDPTNGHGTQNQSLWHVRVGDFLQIGSAEVRRITGILPNSTTFVLTPPSSRVPPGPYQTSDYRVHRNPRPIAGEDVMTLPEGVVVELGNRSRLSSLDIMFSGGAVKNQGGRGKVILWVRDRERQATSEGEQSLVTVYARAGVIITHPVDTQSGDPYSFTRELRSSGQ